MTIIKIEGFSSDSYAFVYERIIVNENEAKFLIKLNFEKSFNCTPILSIKFNTNIVEN